MYKSQILMPEYFDRYINLVPEEHLFTAFENSLQILENQNIDFLSNLQGKTYAEGKWTINEIIQHITDFERILAYRALLFARDFPEAQVGFDEDIVAKNSKANQKQISEIIDELISVRKSTITLFKSFEEEDFQKSGINWKYNISVLAMGFNIIGHQIHHFNVIEEKYYHL